MNYKTEHRIVKACLILGLVALLALVAIGLWRLVSSDIGPAEGATYAPGDSAYFRVAVNDTLGNASDATSVWGMRYFKGAFQESTQATRYALGSYLIGVAAGTSYGDYSMIVKVNGVTGRNPKAAYNWQVDSTAFYGRRPALAAIVTADTVWQNAGHKVREVTGLPAAERSSLNTAIWTAGIRALTAAGNLAVSDSVWSRSRAANLAGYGTVADSVWGGNNSLRELTASGAVTAGPQWAARKSDLNWLPVYFVGTTSGTAITGVVSTNLSIVVAQTDFNPSDISGSSHSSYWLNSSRWREIGYGMYAFLLPDSLVGSTAYSEGIYAAGLIDGSAKTYIGQWITTHRETAINLTQPTGTIADSTWTRFGRITAAGQATVVADSVWGNHGRTLDNPTGAYTVTLNVLQSSDSTAISGANVVVQNLAESSTYQFGSTLANGQFRFTSGNDSLVVKISKAGSYTFNTPVGAMGAKDTLVVSGTNLSATYYGVAFDPGTAVDPTLVRVYGYLIDADGDSISGATVKAQIVGAQNLYETTTKKLVTRRQVSATSNSAGYWYLDLVPNSHMTPSGSKYEFIFSTGERKTVTVGTANANFADLN